MRRAARTDQNQKAIVDALRAAGCGVVDLSKVGGGVPDLLVEAPTWPHAMTLLEVKNPEKPKADRELTPAQVKFHAGWRGSLFVVETVDEALAAVGLKAAA
jgi:hypothetical protein